MEDLVNELSCTMIDVDESSATALQRDLVSGDGDEEVEMCQQQQSKHHKPVARSASILIRSKLLILSDSETEDDDRCPEQRSFNRKNKHRLKSKKQEPLLHRAQLHQNVMQMLAPFSGKRKRSSTVSEGTSTASTSTATQQMECDAITDSSSLSESPCNSDVNCDGDDEQSDFYEVISRTTKSTHKIKHHNHSRPVDFPVPRSNPFRTMGIQSPGSSYNSSLATSNMFWKRRRRAH